MIVQKLIYIAVTKLKQKTATNKRGQILYQERFNYMERLHRLCDLIMTTYRIPISISSLV